MNFPRSAGILLHPTSLPGPYGIGTMGTEARAFIDFLRRAGVGLWQVLPLGPTGYGDSPYQSLSAFAGNPYLIDPDALFPLGLVGKDEVAASRKPNTGKVDFGRLFVEKNKLLDTAWDRFKQSGPDRLAEDFDRFTDENSYWLEDFALFSAIKESQGFAPWNKWPPGLRKRQKAALSRCAHGKGDRLGRHKFVQFLFYRQWHELRAYAKERHVKIIGDIPIFVAYDSADTWSHPELFQLDDSGAPTKVAGVPPDYFTATGQLWGNPLYDWEANRRSGYDWWIARIKSTFALVDILRIDHFRGFESYWAVPAQDSTAANGRWEQGPGIELFTAIEAELGALPIIAEDLGFMTPEVHELRDSLGLPGMKILQFAFEPAEENGDHPHNYLKNCVVYTGTHDNDTCMGWLSGAKPDAKRRALHYTKGHYKSFAWDMIQTAWASPACMAVAPVQDLLMLGSEARMNFPGRQEGYWTWRMDDDALSPRIERKLRTLTKTYFR